MVVDRTWNNDIPYEHPHALLLPLLFHGGGPWDEKRKAEWLRITGCREATTRVLCDHIRRTMATLNWQP